MISSSAVVDTNGTTSNVSRPVLMRQDSHGVDSRFCCNICLEAVVEPVVTQCGHLYCWPCLYRWLEPGMHPEERATLGIVRRLPAMVDASRRVCPVCKAPCSVPALVPIYVRSEVVTPKRDNDDDDDDDDEAIGGAQPTTRSTEDALSASTDNDTPTTTTNNTDTGEAETGWEERSGLRQRLRFQSRDSMEEDPVPSRPAATSPRPSPNSPSTPSQNTPQTTNYHTRTNNWMTPLSPNGHAASLSHGILLSFQQATSSASSVPPLHNHRQSNSSGHHASDFDVGSPGATEYLSRLLILLASFVVLCLLLL